MTTSNPPSHQAKRAFTLVEMLMVIVIIGILAGLISAGVVSARKSARVKAQKMEIHNLASGMEAYRQKYGEYPPSDFTDLDAVRRHLRKAFPRYDIRRVGAANTDYYVQFVADLAPYGLDPTVMDAAAALVFWLGGLPEAVPGANETWAPSGFSANPTNPFQPGGSRLASFYTFQPDSTRLIRVGGTLRYLPTGVTTAPYVYFRARRDVTTSRFEYGYARPTAATPHFQPYFCVFGANNVCVPYLDWQDGDPTPSEGSNAAATIANTTYRRWRNAESFQILSPGLDGYYGFWDPAPVPPTDVPATPNPFSPANPYWYRYSRILVNLTPPGADRDNIASFSDGTLDDESRTP